MFANDSSIIHINVLVDLIVILSMSYPTYFSCPYFLSFYGVIKDAPFQSARKNISYKVQKMHSFKEVIKLKLKVMTGKILLTFTSKVQ